MAPSRGSADYKHYIPVGNTTVEYVRRSNGTNNTYYATSDHLGSSDFVTCGSDVSGCSAGTVLVRESFNAFGSRRGSSWSGSPTSTDMNNIASTTRTGFTGQEMMDNLNLVNMNGRIYNPAIGRFISADPHVIDPGNTQNYNRYSYVLNNPLRYVDPTGFDLEEVVVKGTRSSGGGAGFSSDDGGGGATTSGGDGDEGQQLDFMNTEKNAATNKPAPAKAGQNKSAKQLEGLVILGIKKLKKGDSITIDCSSQQELCQTLVTDLTALAQQGITLSSPVPGKLVVRPAPQLQEKKPEQKPTEPPKPPCSDGPSYLDRYVNWTSDHVINVGPHAAALAGGLWPKSGAPAGAGRLPLLGSTNPLTSVPRAFGMPGADSMLVRTGAAGIGLLTVGIGFYDLTIELEGFLYAIPSQGTCPTSP